MVIVEVKVYKLVLLIYLVKEILRYFVCFVVGKLLCVFKVGFIVIVENKKVIWRDLV